jgi:hypothetical protein
LLWLIPLLEKFPRSQKFLLGDRIENMLLDIMELVIQAIYTKNKSRYLREANLKIEKFRHLIRLAKDLKYINIRRYEYISEHTHEIGSEIGGWLKYSVSNRI